MCKTEIEIDEARSFGGPMMNKRQFWTLIEEANGGSEPPDVRLAERLREQPLHEIASFQAHFDEAFHAAYRWDLWCAAHLITEGLCTDDGFTDFRAGLISMGRKVYSAALRSPDSMARQDPLPYFYEEYGYVARQVYEELAEEVMPDGVDWPKEPAGKKWDFSDDEELRSRLPRLYKRCRSCLPESDANER